MGGSGNDSMNNQVMRGRGRLGGGGGYQFTPKGPQVQPPQTVIGLESGVHPNKGSNNDTAAVYRRNLFCTHPARSNWRRLREVHARNGHNKCLI